MTFNEGNAFIETFTMNLLVLKLNEKIPVFHWRKKDG